MSNVICLGGGVESVPIVQRVQELGHTAIVVDRNPTAPAREMADRFVEASCYDAHEMRYALRASGLTFDGVLCCAVDAPVACAEIARLFGLPGMSPTQANRGQDKLWQKKLLNGRDIPVPRFSPALSGRLIEDWAGVVKPIDSRGGRGVVRLLPGVDPAWAFEQAQAQSPSRQVLTEEWLDGPQLSTESIVQDGRVLFTAIGLRNYDRLDEFAPYAIEDGFDEPCPPLAPPAPQGEQLASEVNAVIERAARALGWYPIGAGTVKGDLVIHAGKVYVIELACRLAGGFFATHGHPLAYNVDFVGYAIRAALGERLDVPIGSAGQFVSQRYLFPRPEQIGRTVVALEGDAPEFHTWNIQPGDVIKPVTCHPARWGQVITAGATPDEASARAQQTAARLAAGVVTA